MVKENTSALNNPKAPDPFFHFEIVIIKRRNRQQFRKIASKNVPRAGVSSGSFGSPTRHLSEAPLVAGLTQEGVTISPTWQFRHTPKGLSPSMDQAAAEDDWCQEPWELLAAQPWGPSMASSQQHPPMGQLLGYLLSQEEM